MKGEAVDSSDLPISGADMIGSLHSAIIDGIQTGLTIVDREFRIVRANEYTRKRVKRTEEEIQGEHCYRLFHRREDICSDCPVAVTFATGKSHSAKHTGVDRHGRLTYAELTSHPIKNASGEVCFVMEYARDISERIEFEGQLASLVETLRHRNNELEVLHEVGSVVAASLDLEDILAGALESTLRALDLQPRGGIFLLDEGGRKLRLIVHKGLQADFVRREREVPVGECLCGLAARSGEFICSADSCHDHRHERQFEDAHSHIIVPLKSHDRVQGVMFLYPNGGYQPSASDRRLYELIGRQIGVAIDNARLFLRTDAQLQRKVVELTNALAEAEQERTRAREIERLKDDFVSLVSHDLRSPLTIILMQAELLYRRSMAQADAATERSAENMLRAGRRMKAMIADLVDSARLESGQISLRPTTFAPIELLADLVDSLPAAEAERVRLACPEDLPRAVADRERVERILANLAGNALKYSPAGSPIVIRLCTLSGELVFAVTDEGEGIDAEHREHIFERFYRATSQTGVQGLGLGLYIAKLLVAAHGGRLWVESPAPPPDGLPDRGSTFYFTLPLAPHADRQRTEGECKLSS